MAGPVPDILITLWVKIFQEVAKVGISRAAHPVARGVCDLTGGRLARHAACNFFNTLILNFLSSQELPCSNHSERATT